MRVVIENKSCILAPAKSFSTHAKTRLQSTAWENDLNSVLPIAHTSFKSQPLLSLIPFSTEKGSKFGIIERQLKIQNEWKVWKLYYDFLS